MTGDMFLLASILVIAVCLGLLRGGRLSRIPEPTMWWLALVGLVLQAVPATHRVVGAGLLLASYGLLAWFAWRNRRSAGFWLILVGLGANLCVVALNGGMPVSADALRRAGLSQQPLIAEGGVKHYLADGDEALMPLADALPIGAPYRMVVSPGDVVMYLGVGVYVFAGMGRRQDSLPANEPDDVG